MNYLQHAEDGMMVIRRKGFSHESCRRQPTFGVEGGMVDIYGNRCVKTGSRMAPYCLQRAEGSVIYVSRGCSTVDALLEGPTAAYQARPMAEGSPTVQNGIKRSVFSSVGSSGDVGGEREEVSQGRSGLADIRGQGDPIYNAA